MPIRRIAIHLPSLRRVLAVLLSGVVVLGIAAAIVINGLTQTPRGHEMVRRIALSVLHGPIHGRVQIGRIDGNLLHTAIVHNLVITDSTGAPFLSVGRVEAHYNLRDFAHQWVFLDHIQLDRPTITLTRTPAGTMNVSRIFPTSPSPPTTPQPPSTSGWGSALVVSDIHVRDGTVIVDSMVAVHDLTAVIPGVTLAAPPPFSQTKSIDVALLRGSVGIAALHPADVRNLVATVFFTSDSLWWSSATLLLPESHVTSSGRFAFADGATDVTAHAQPVTLADAQFIDPHIPADGKLTGDIAVSMRGTMQQYLVSNLDLTAGQPPARIRGRAGIRLGSTPQLLDTDLDLQQIDTRLVHEIAPTVRLPREGVLDGRVVASGTRADLTFIGSDLHFHDRTTGELATASVRGVLLGDSVRIDTAQVRAFATTIGAHGTLAFKPPMRFAASFRVAVDTLATLGHIAATMMRNPQLDSLGGKLVTAGNASGTLRHFMLHDTTSATQLAAFGVQVGHLETALAWAGGPSLTSPITATIHADSVSTHGQTLDTVDAHGTFQKPTVTLAVRVRHGVHQTLAVAATVHLNPTNTEVQYDSIVAVIDSAGVHSTQPGTVRWSAQGLALHDVRLQSFPQLGRLTVDGTVPVGAPPTTPMDVQLAIDSVSPATIRSFLGSAPIERGTMAVHASIGGTAGRPTMTGSADLADGAANGQPLPNAHISFHYDTLVLTAHAELSRSRAMDSLLMHLAASDSTVPFAKGPFMTADATLPVDLALTDTGARVLERPLTASLVAEQFPLAVLPQFVSTISAAGGTLRVHASAAGTPQHPKLSGAASIAQGRFSVAPLGITLTQASAGVHLQDNMIYVDSIDARSRGPIRLRGTIDVAHPANPIFDVTLRSRGARVIDDRTSGKVDLDDSLTVKGALDSASIAGSVRIRDAILYVPDPGGKQVIDVTSQTVYYVADTSNPAIRALIPAPSPILDKLKINVHLGVDRNTWVRNNAANIEVYTDEPITIHLNPSEHALILAGAVNTDRGQYTFFGKRFEITRGIVTFVGTPVIDPALNITGQYAVGTPGQQPINIQILVGGNMTAPTLALHSDAQPPLSQTDLLTYLAFGQPASQLSAGGAASSGGAGASGSGISNLAGSLGPYVAQRLAGEAIGTFTQELQGDIGRSIGADVLNITPAPGVPSEVSAKGVTGYLRNTELEFGKYVTPATYLGLDVVSIAPPGAKIEQRIGPTSSVAITLQPWYLADPTLSPTPNITTKDVIGLTLTRTWRF